MGVAHGPYAIVVGGVAPDGIETDIRSRVCAEDNGVEGNGLVFLTEHEIAIYVLKGKDAVTAVSNPLNHESSAAVGAGYTFKGARAEYGVGIGAVEGGVAVKSYKHTLHRFEIFSREDIPGHFHRVYGGPCGE